MIKATKQIDPNHKYILEAVDTMENCLCELLRRKISQKHRGLLYSKLEMVRDTRRETLNRPVFL